MFTDLEIRIFPLQQDAGYPVEMTLGFQQEFPRGYLAEDIVPWQSSGDLLVDGQRLFDTLFADDALRDAWVTARGQEPQCRLRLRIHPDAAELHALPWELLYDHNVMLSASDATPFSRYLPIALPWVAGDEVCPMRVLVVVANPDNLEADYELAQLDAAAERAALEAGLADFGEAVELTFMEPPITLERLEVALRDAEGYHIVHYVGHGAFSRRRNQAALYMADDVGQVSVVTDAALVGMLARLPKDGRPRLIFLAACQSAVRSTGDAFQGLAPKLVRVGVPAVIAMQDFLTIETSRKLNTRFYQYLAEHGNIDLALNQARSALLTTGRPDAAVPTLFMRLKSGQLWDPKTDAGGTVLGAKNPRIFWSGLIKMIKRGKCIPIVGPRVHGQWLPTPNAIAAKWSATHAYPLEDKHRLARVSQYLASSQGADFPRYELLDTLKTYFLAHVPEELHPDEDVETLSELVELVGWENLVAGNPNTPHTVLANLGLPLYLTTNPDNFMAEALFAKGRDPAREVCRWKDDLDWLSSLFEDDPDYEPDVDAPLVYHLFGSDEEADSLVITEDNYLDFLVQVSAEMNRIPNFIRGALANASLMFVGYSLYDWEFRVIMRGLVATLENRRRFKHVAVQLELNDTESLHVGEVQEFLRQYFQDADINVFWGTTAQFVAELREHWEDA